MILITLMTPLVVVLELPDTGGVPDLAQARRFHPTSVATSVVDARSGALQTFPMSLLNVMEW